MGTKHILEVKDGKHANLGEAMRSLQDLYDSLIARAKAKVCFRFLLSLECASNNSLHRSSDDSDCAADDVFVT